MNDLAQAAIDNDNLADQDGYQAVLRDLDLDEADLRYVAGQRALRAVMVRGGRTEELKALAAASHPKAVSLTPDEQAQIEALLPVYLDGISLGVRYGLRP